MRCSSSSIADSPPAPARPIGCPVAGAASVVFRCCGCVTVGFDDLRLRLDFDATAVTCKLEFSSSGERTRCVAATKVPDASGLYVDHDSAALYQKNTVMPVAPNPANVPENRVFP